MPMKAHESRPQSHNFFHRLKLIVKRIVLQRKILFEVRGRSVADLQQVSQGFGFERSVNMGLHGSEVVHQVLEDDNVQRKD